jgi:hypothetical protein
LEGVRVEPQSRSIESLLAAFKGLRFVNDICKTGVEMAIIGYARVSTQGQDLTGQLEALKHAGAETIFREKVSGVRADRPQLVKLMASLKVGYIVVVTKLDRLGRATRELLEVIERIGKAGASFRSLGFAVGYVQFAGPAVVGAFSHHSRL